jgi:hypothetical protein
VKKVNLLLLIISIFMAVVITANTSFGMWNWRNIAEPIAETPYFKVIQVYEGMEFSIKWDKNDYGVFLAGDAIVRFRDITDFNNIEGVLNNYSENQGLTIHSTNWVYANVKKAGTLIIYAPFSSSIELIPDIFLSDRSRLSAWEINSPPITSNYRIKSFMSRSKGTNPFPEYFGDLKLKDEVPINYAPFKNCDNEKIFVVGSNVDSDILSSGSKVNFAPYDFATLNRYYFRIFEKTNISVDKLFANPDWNLNYTNFGVKSVMAVFMLSDKTYVDIPANAYPPSPGHYYQVDTADAIKDCHFWSYAKMFDQNKYEQIKNYKGYDAIFPIGLMEYNIVRYAYPQYFTQADNFSKKCTDYGVIFENPVMGNKEKQEGKDGFIKYYYANRLEPLAR